MDTIVGGSEQSRYPLAHHVPRQLTATAKTKITFVRIDTNLLDALLTQESRETYEVSEILDGDDSDWMTQILKSKAFANLPASNIQALFMHLEEFPAKAGDVVVRQGEEGEYFYILRSGRCKVIRRTQQGEKTLAELGPGDSFGEEALIADARRNATIAMLTDGALMRLAKSDFMQLMKEPLIRWVTYDQAAEMVNQGAAWLDVRLPSEHKQASIAGSMNVPLSMLRSKADEFDPTKKYITFCDSGNRSSVAAFLLCQRGYDAYVLAGGYTDAAGAKPAAEAGAKDSDARDDSQAKGSARKPVEVIQFNAPQAGGKKKAAREPAEHRGGAESKASVTTTDDAARREQLEAELDRLKTELKAEQERSHKKAEEETSKRLKAEATVAKLQKEQQDALRKAQQEAKKRHAVEAEAERAKSEAQMARKVAEEEAARLHKERKTLKAKARKELEALQEEREVARKTAEDEATRLKQEAETARRKAQEEAARLREEAEAARRKAGEEAERLRAEAAEVRKRAEEEGKRLKTEREAVMRKAEEEAVRLKQEAEAVRRKAEEEARKRSEETASRIVAEAEAAKQRAEQEAARLLAEAESARIEAKAEASRMVAEQEKARLQAQEDVARLQSEAETARLKAEEAKRRQSEAEAGRAAAEEEAARIYAEADNTRMEADQKAASALAEAEAARLEAQEEAARIQADADSARLKAEEAAARLEAEAEKARMNLKGYDEQQLEEVARLESEAEAARLEAEEALRMKAQAEDARKQAEQEAARVRAEAEVARTEAEQRAEQLMQEAQAARAQAHQEADQVKEDAEAARLRAEVEAARLASEAEAARRKAEEHTSRMKAEAANAKDKADQVISQLVSKAEAVRHSTSPGDSAPIAQEIPPLAEPEENGEEVVLAGEIPSDQRDEQNNAVAPPQDFLDDVDEMSRLIDRAAQPAQTPRDEPVPAVEDNEAGDAIAAAAKQRQKVLLATGGAALLLVLVVVGVVVFLTGGEPEPAFVEPEAAEPPQPIATGPKEQTGPALEEGEEAPVPGQVQPEEAAVPTTEVEQLEPEPGAEEPEPIEPPTEVAAEPEAGSPAERASEPETESPAEAEVPAAPETFRDPLRGGGFGPEMVRVPAGSFAMGSPTSSTRFDERPQHEVSLPAFSVSRYEITVAEYARFLRAVNGPDAAPAPKGEDARRPVINVSWEDARRYAEWLSGQTGHTYRLPSEAEWEYIATAAGDTDFWWGDSIGENRANCFDCGSQWDASQPAPVGSFDPNPFGVFDTAGNVMEWTQDCYNRNYAGAPGDGSAWLNGNCRMRVVRGGSYSSPSDSLRARKRSRYPADTKLDSIGIRLVRED